MININNAIILLDATINCRHRRCDDCREMYEDMGNCPLETYRDEYKNILMTLEKINDYAVENNIEITEEEFLKMLKGECYV